MKEFIERAAAMDAILGLTIADPAVAQYADAVYYHLQNLPAADVVGVRHGRWIVSEMNLGYCDIIQKEYIAKKYTCSECGYETGEQAKKFACCPICMARMDKEADREAG